MQILYRIGLFVGLAAAVVGCSQSGRASSRVTGTVTYKGQPVKAGLIFLAYEEGGKYQAGLQADGSYQFIGVPAGKTKVFIDNLAFDPDQKPQSYSQHNKRIASGMAKGYGEYNRMAGGGEKANKGDDGVSLSKEKREELAKVYVKLPKKYTDEKTTPIDFTVESGRQTKDFDLTD